MNKINHASYGSERRILDDIESFPALRLDYIAIHKNFRRRGIGSILLAMIRERALQDTLSSTLFIIVDTYDTSGYSSVGFYKKNFFKESEYGIIQKLNKKREGKRVDTKLMYPPLFK